MKKIALASLALLASCSSNAATPMLADDSEKLVISVNNHTLTATFADNTSAVAFKDLLAEGPLTISMSDYGNFEKVGSLPRSLPRNDERITTTAGDIILYQGNSITIYYDTNTWSFTRLGKIDNVTQTELKSILGTGSATVTFSLASQTSVDAVKTAQNADSPVFDLQGRRVAASSANLEKLPSGVYVVNGKKIRVK